MSSSDQPTKPEKKALQECEGSLAKKGFEKLRKAQADLRRVFEEIKKQNEAAGVNSSDTAVSQPTQSTKSKGTVSPDFHEYWNEPETDERESNLADLDLRRRFNKPKTNKKKSEPVEEAQDDSSSSCSTAPTILPMAPTPPPGPKAHDWAYSRGHPVQDKYEGRPG